MDRIRTEYFNIKCAIITILFLCIITGNVFCQTHIINTISVKSDYKLINNPLDTLLMPTGEWFSSLNDSLQKLHSKPVIYSRKHLEKLRKTYFDSLQTPYKIVVNLMNAEFAEKLRNEVMDSLNTQDFSKFELNYLPRLENIELPVKQFKLIEDELDLLEKDKEPIESIPLTRNEELVELKSSKSMPSKLSFDGLIGISRADEMIYRLSPALVYDAAKNFKLGLGPQFNLNESIKEYAPVSFRSFLRKEFSASKLYIQGEYQAIQKDYKQEYRDLKNPLLLGGGYKIPLTSQTFLNSSLLLNLRTSQYADQRLVFRIGITAPFSKVAKP